MEDEQEPAARTLMTEMVEATRGEPGAQNYEWHIGDEGSVCHIFERYADSDAALEHLENFGANSSERFMTCFAPTALYAYGAPNEDVRAALDDFGAVYLAPFGGFSR